jgi:histidyl-tRNA synthetase
MMGSSKILSLPGMIDMTGSAYQQSAEVAETLASYLASQDYEPIDTPIVEDAHLFIRKSGSELSGMLYTFDDPGGNGVSLRPEFTPSVIRYYVEHSSKLQTPVRWRYNGPVFRYDQLGIGKLRQYTQIGAELIGVTGTEADAEIVGLAWKALGEIGLDDCIIRIGDTGLLNSVLGVQGLSDTAKNFVVNHVVELREDSDSVDGLVTLAGDMGLLQTEVEIEVGGQTAVVGSGVTKNFIQEMLSDAMSNPVGRRTTEQIVDRLFRKLQRADHPDKLRAALGLVAELSRIEGHPDQALGMAAEVLHAHKVSPTVLDGLGRLIEKLNKKGLPTSNLVLDLGLIRGMAYYTGVVFEIACVGDDNSTVIGGGGRYDGLVQALGGADVPAMGFAFSVEKIMSQLAEKAAS